jgi:hypothetical protein
MTVKAPEDQRIKRARDHDEARWSCPEKSQVEPFGFACFKDSLDEIERASKRTAGEYLQYECTQTHRIWPVGTRTLQELQHH